MINPIDYVKSYEQTKRQKRKIYSEKSLKNKMRFFVPNETTIKSFLLSKHNKHVHESQLLQLYKFWEIPKSQYEKIFSNPLYYMGNEMHFRMFKFFLSKNILDRKLAQNTNQAAKSSPKYRNSQMQYQFNNKKLINYQDPWRFVDYKIAEIQAVNKAAPYRSSHQVQTDQNNQTNLQKQFNPQIYHSTIKNRVQPFSTKKSVSFKQKSFSHDTPNLVSHQNYKQKISERQSQIKNLKRDMQFYRESKRRQLSHNLLTKLNGSQKRLDIKKQQKSFLLRQQSADLLIKTQRCKLKKQYSQKMFDTARNFNQKIRQACLKNVGKNKSSSLAQSRTQQKKTKNSFINRFLIQSKEKLKARQSILKKYLEARIGIEESQSKK